MQYNQKTVDKIRGKLTRSMRMTIYRNVNKGKRNPIPYSTVCEVLRNYREGGRERYRNRRLAVYDEAVKLLTEKGIEI